MASLPSRCRPAQLDSESYWDFPTARILCSQPSRLGFPHQTRKFLSLLPFPLPRSNFKTQLWLGFPFLTHQPRAQGQQSDAPKGRIATQQRPPLVPKVPNFKNKGKAPIQAASPKLDMCYHCGSKDHWLHVSRVSPEAIAKYHSHREAHHPDYPIKSIRLDNVEEFTSQTFDDYCMSVGIDVEHPVPYVYTQNGLAEAFIKHLQMIAQTLVMRTKLPVSAWGYAILPATMLLVTGYEPDVLYLRVFGCAIYVPIVSPLRTKMSPQRKMRIYVDYDSPSIVRYLEPLIGDLFITRLADYHFDKTVFSSLRGDKHANVPVKRRELSWYAPTMSHLDPHTAQSETEMYPAYVNNPPRKAGPSPKMGRPHLPYERCRPPENREISVHYTVLDEVWNRNEMIVNDAFLYSVTTDIMLSNGIEPRSIDECRRRTDCQIGNKQSRLNSIRLRNCTRHDISFAVNLLARYSNASTRRHWNGVKDIFRYLKGTTDLGLFYTRESPCVAAPYDPQIDSRLVGYVDTGYLFDPHKARSQMGYVFTVGDTAISWRSTKQTLVATSSNHAEILALHEASHDGLTLVVDLSMTIFEDNAACIEQFKKGYIKGDNTKHIQQHQNIEVKQICSQDNLVDLFTKSLPKSILQKLVQRIDMRKLSELNRL
ncbi:retrotransposon protein [Pyrus ussuriensis x Pyrus communis]|uniref:Retrotransposon protein n=1 Tax=Pyrus ussuriensis x Pyrus communis TaxID=2448454 RepID=A0A5N5EWZ1_9ROSA|nr:retrotransposon protein [Pyrus ussuriensis x Pyrus communis]